MAKFEIEIRGGLPTDLSKKALLDHLTKEFTTYEYTRELVLFFRYEHDFRFKFIHDQGELVLKKKLENQANQKEWVTKIQKEDISNFIFQLVHLGYTEGLLSTGERYVFKKDNFELCLKYETPIGDFFEIEEIVDSENAVPSTEQKLAAFIEQFGLKAWNDEEYTEIKKLSLQSLKKVSLLDESGNSINKEIESFIYKAV